MDPVQANGHTPPGEPHILTRAEVQERERFPLTYTGGEARVRKLTLAQLVAFGNLSPTMHPTVMEVFGIVLRDGENADVTSGGNAFEIQRKNQALINEVCMLGFLKPRLVSTREEADAANDPHVWCVEELDPRDAQAYYNLLTAPEEEAAKVMEPFPEVGLEGPATDEGLPPEPETVAADEAGGGDALRSVELSVV